MGLNKVMEVRLCPGLSSSSYSVLSDHDGLSWKAFVALNSAVHMKIDRNSCVENEKRELELGECSIASFGKLQKWKDKDALIKHQKGVCVWGGL